MNRTLLTPDAKEALRKAVRGLRAQLVEQIAEATRGEYRLDVAVEKAALPEPRLRRRERLEAWIAEQARGLQADARKPASKKGSKGKAAAAPTSAGHRRFIHEAAKEAAYTLLHRLVLVRILEHHGLLAPAAVTGGWKSAAYAGEFLDYAGPLAAASASGDDTRGYRDLLEVVFGELAIELPGLFGSVGVSSLLPVPAASLRAVVAALDDPALVDAWGDDTTLGWVYQYWNDPDREALDRKIADGGKIEPHEIASKTQMFTERYMVEWLLQNSLGLTWLAICKKNEWTADAEAVIPVLDARRAAWRARREAGEVALDALMPIAPGIESDWKYWVPQPIPDDAVASALGSVRDVKLLDPACGSGHFLVIALGLLRAMHREEARHRGESWSDAEIVESILARNLHGIDIDPRAIQIAAAALWLEAKLAAPAATVAQLNLVAPTFRLAGLPADDPALARLLDEVGALGVPRALTLKLVESLRGVGHLGTLLRVDREITRLLDEETVAHTGPLFAHGAAMKRAALEAKLAEFLDAHAAEADLGLRLGAEQLAAGLRFVGMVKEGTYDVVVGNPPYQGLSKTAQFEYVATHYPRGKADLYAAFLERGLELVREGGVSALVTMRGWMFLGQFKELRKLVLHDADIRTIGDFDRGAFDEVPNEVLAVSAPIIRRGRPDAIAVGMQPTPSEDVSYDRQRTNRKRAAVLLQVGRHEFDPKSFAVIEGEPIVYWWTKDFLARYAAAPKLGSTTPARFGLTTGDNDRFVRLFHEIEPMQVSAARAPSARVSADWSPFVMGGKGRAWIEPTREACRWSRNGLEVKEKCVHQYGSVSKQIRNEAFYFVPGVAFTMIGSEFTGRAHRTPGVVSNKGSSVFPSAIDEVTCLMNSRLSREILSGLNPGLGFEVGDVNRLPVFPVSGASRIFATVEREFSEHEAHREPSVEFRSPGRSSWSVVQEWAQTAVDRAEGALLPPYEPVFDEPVPEAWASFTIGVALGRFGANGEGTLDEVPPDALPAGILLVGPDDAYPDSLRHPAAARIADAWTASGAAITGSADTPLRDWLRKDFFAHHKGVYENRPIYFPLSSEKRSFVAWTSIHRWTDATLQVLLADHLLPVLRQIDGEIADLNTARASTTDRKAASAAEKRYGKTRGLRDELAGFIETVRQVAERGAPPSEKGGKARDADAPYRMDLDDGVMINSAALWPLLEPQWKDPRKWWKQLCEAQGKKDYDWSHLARRYFPERVEAKCKEDPSLGVAHGCFWRYHPARAFAWELRLQDEIRPGFTIDEKGSDAARAAFLREHAALAEELREKERVRRERKAARAESQDAEGEDAVDSADAETDDAERAEE